MTENKAEENIKIILSKLEEDALFALSRTVTQGFKKCTTAKEAIQNIIKYSPDYISILRRKAVTREILFRYLDETNVKIQMPMTKNDLIDTIANVLNLPCLGSQCSTKVKPEYLKSEEESNVNVMAQEFSKWFYSMLNSNECGVEHFFPDAQLKINRFDNTECETIEIEDNLQQVTHTLLDVRLKNHLYFNLNETTDGIQGRIDPHGLVMVLACGTLHTEDKCFGVFEQVFALARDPFSENNWKIKRSELNLRLKKDVSGYPKLCESELTQDLLLMLPVE